MTRRSLFVLLALHSFDLRPLSFGNMVPGLVWFRWDLMNLNVNSVNTDMDSVFNVVENR